MAQTDYFLDIDGIKGDSTDKKFKGKIDVQSWSWGESNAGTAGQGGGHGAGKVSMQDFHFTMTCGISSPKLLLACANGEHIKKAVMTCRKAGTDQQEYLVMTFEGVMISSFQTGGSGGAGVIPTDQIGLSYEKMKYEYRPQNDNGTLGAPVAAGWDLTANVKYG
jgi:type VI secretion system secreted protein Hcp